MQNQHTIHSLRKAGNKLRIRHYRNVVPSDLTPPKLALVTKEAKKARMFRDIRPRGGRTEIDLTNQSGVNITVHADCSKKDPFNRKLGLRICINRLVASGVIGEIAA